MRAPPRSAGVISPGPPFGVKPPCLRPPPAARGLREKARALRWSALAGAILALALPASPTDAREPLCDWLGGLAESAQALSRGDATTAEASARRALAARSHGPAAALASAALGLALSARGASSDAADALEGALAGPPVPARAHLELALAEALLASGQAPLAARHFARAASARDLAVTRRARFRGADALLAAALPSEAVPELQACLSAWPDDPAASHARLALGRGLRALGDDARAQATWRALWLERPADPEAREAEALLSAWRAAIGPVPAFTGVEHAQRAERLLAGGFPEEALAELLRATDAEPPEPGPERAGALRGAALLALGRSAEAADAVAPALDGPDPGARRGALLVLARIAARAGRAEEATERYARLAPIRADVPGLPGWRQRDLEDEATFLAAWLWYDAGEFSRAATALDAFARSRRGSRRADDATWFAAWSRYRLGRPADAARELARLSPGPLAPAAEYWRARFAGDRGRRLALYRQALRDGGDGWYGLLARARLAELGEATPRGPEAAQPRTIPEVNNSASAARLAVAVEMLGLGLRGAALEELRDLGRGPRARQAAPLIAQLASFAGDPELPFLMARDHMAPTRRALRWAHPEPYADRLEPAARKLGLDPSLVYAVMRRESRFDARARSSAGARGLLQLRPVTAERTVALLHLHDGVTGAVDDPEQNLAIGAHYLALLVSRFGDPVVALAAYNAGPALAEGWARARAGQPLDAWVESIPFRETREYVKIVGGEWNVYRSLDGEPTAPVDPARPIPAPSAGVAY